MKISIGYSLTVFICSFLIFYSGCESESTTTPNPPEQESSGTEVVTSSQSATFEVDGFRMEIHGGDVPRQTDGSDGTVTFSMNTSSNLQSGVPNIPSGYSVIGKYLKAGPELFNFYSPVSIFFPASSQSIPQNLVVLQYTEGEGWRMIPTSALDTVNRKVGADLLNLGYFVLAKQNVTDAISDFRTGGCVLDRQEMWMNFILTVNTVTPEKPEILNLYSGGLIGKTYQGPIFYGCPTGLTKAIVPQGTISFWVTRSYCQNPPSIETYSIPASVTVPEPLTYVGWSTYDATYYYPFDLPAGGSWVPGRPANWPPPTVPFGTGTLQATLTWLNTSTNSADIDLHLYGPNNLHVYYAVPSTPNFSLDRDWQLQSGNAVENIFSTTTSIPSGDYRVNVAHYSGSSVSFNCRVIVNGNVTNYSNNLGGGSVDVRTFSIP